MAGGGAGRWAGCRLRGQAVTKALTAAAAALTAFPLFLILLITGIGSTSTPTQGGSHAAATAIAFALAQLGKPYQWGAVGPGAYDCSGLVYAAYAAAGIRIARTTYQWQHDGPVVPLSQIQPGDLLFSAGSDGTASDPGHVVMYLGNGQVIQAPQTGQDVQTGPVHLASVVVATRPAALTAKP
jgi:cell wall-associated NlpC family hydrolase